MSENIWKRPENVPFPSIWSRFQGKKPINGKIPKFWIQDIPEDMFDQAVDFMCINFIYEDPLCKYSKFAEDEQSMAEVKFVLKFIVEQKMGLICFMENPEGEKIIAGLNMTYPSGKDEIIPPLEGKKCLKLLETNSYIKNIKDSFEMLGIDVCLTAMGLSVLPEFRGQGIGEALLQARTPLCKAVGLKATITLFSAIASQTIAERIGFKDIVNMSYEDLEKENPRFKYPGISEHTKNFRYMYKLV